jgi:hypothetical protein
MFVRAVAKHIHRMCCCVRVILEYVYVPTMPCSYIPKPLNAEEASSLVAGRQAPSFWAVDQTCSRIRVMIMECWRSQCG